MLREPRLSDPFYLLVVDEDRNQFTVEGPMQDDTGGVRGGVQPKI
jgi:hypothetical protein